MLLYLRQPSELWESSGGRRLLAQAVFLVFLVLLGMYAWGRAQRLDLDIDFMRSPAGFALANQWLTDYRSTESRWAAYGAGVFNTLRLVLVGIALATILGVVAGVARLSGNWLVARIAALYVEIVRNTPLLVQIIFWYTAVLLKLPRISEGRSISDVIFISNRGLAIPWFTFESLGWLWLAILALAGAAAFALRRLRQRQEEESGERRRPNLVAAITFLVLATAGFVLAGTPVDPEVPQLVVPDRGAVNYQRGMVVTPEFAAMLFALVIYTAAFITEIVRGSIQSLPRGQFEAASALGLSGYERMTLVILPQALRTMIPALTNQYLNLSKNSSLAVVIGYSELFFVTGVIINNAGHAVPMFAIIAATYMAISLTISAVMNTLNRRVQLVGQ